MAGLSTPIVFITANVGSIFEEPSVMLKIWTEEFMSTIARLDPKFIALHCQEVGGKNYEKSMQHVEHFVQLLINSEELRLFDKVKIFLDEDYSSAENFTALGNFYFIHESVKEALIYDFQLRSFVQVEGQEIHSHNIEDVSTKEKSKFPLQYFPECKWSRKGFLRTRWNLNGTIFDLVNIHLFHDASNFVAIESFPSVYSDTRRRALSYTLERFLQDDHDSVPLFLFGDFNFRADTQGVVKRLSEGLDSAKVEGKKSDGSFMHFKENDKVVLSLGKKEFNHSDHQAVFMEKDGDWLREFDKELLPFENLLFEFGITFPPSYPFEENSTGDRCYMKTRCPAWCDRVVMTPAAAMLVKNATNPDSVEYGLIGRTACMGDHKPVYLRLDMKQDTVKCLEEVDEDAVDQEMKETPCELSEDVVPDEVVQYDKNWTKDDLLDRYGMVKRVNSASVVENKSKKEDWKNSRCNSDVTSNQVTKNWRGGKPFYRGSSKVRLISSSNSLNASLPRLTSHHSSSDEEWFEEVLEGDDDVLKMKCDDADGQDEEHAIAEEEHIIDEVRQYDNFVATSKVKLDFLVGNLTGHSEGTESEKRRTSSGSVKMSIFKRLTQGRKGSHPCVVATPEVELPSIKHGDSFENLVVKPRTDDNNSVQNSGNADRNTGNEIIHRAADIERRADEKQAKSAEGWENIELCPGKTTKMEKKQKSKGCCVLQ